MNKVELTNKQLSEMTMDLLVRRLSEESPHLCSHEHGNGILEIFFKFNDVPKVSDRFSLIKQCGDELKVTFPARKYDPLLFKNNIRILHYVIQKYLAIRVVPQGRIKVEFRNGVISDFELINEGTYKDMLRLGKPKLCLDDILFSDDDENGDGEEN